MKVPSSEVTTKLILKMVVECELNTIQFCKILQVINKENRVESRKLMDFFKYKRSEHTKLIKSKDTICQDTYFHCH